MAGGATYILKGYGSIDPLWVRDCFRLFKDRSINIRKLVLLKNGQPEQFAMLEIQFVLPLSEAEKAEPDLFLTELQKRIASQRWNKQTLTAV